VLILAPPEIYGIELRPHRHSVICHYANTGAICSPTFRLQSTGAMKPIRTIAGLTWAWDVATRRHYFVKSIPTAFTTIAVTE
jgi:hypothetical protein